METRAHPGQRLILPAYVLSGACALVYQLVWYHYFIDHLGATGTTYLVVLCTFIGGLGLGSLLSRRATSWLTRVTRFRGLALYGLIELFIALLVIALIGLTRIPLVHAVGSFPYREVGMDYLTLFVPGGFYQALKIGLALAAIGLPCTLMGLTYPYICSLFPSDDRFPSQLYAVNTLGACLAILAAEFMGFPSVGYFRVLLIALAVNLLIALFFLFSGPLSALAAREERGPAPGGAPLSDYPAILSGFLCGGLEALAFIFIKLTYFSAKGIFALMSFHAIAGIWIAATIVHRFRPGPRALIAGCWAALAWCVGLWFVEPGLGEAFVQWCADHLQGTPLYPKGVLVTFIYTAFYISLPYACLSTLLPALCDQKQAHGENLSRTYGLNTVAFLAGVLVFGWVLQYAHPFYAARIFAVASAAGILLLGLQGWGKPITIRAVALPVVVLAAGFALAPASLAMRLIGGQEVGPTPKIWASTPQHLFWVRMGMDERPDTLMFDRHPMSAVDAAGQRYMRMMAHFPLLLHPQPRNALLICYGVGNTADAIRMHETVERLDIVDLNATVFRLSRAFQSMNHDVLADPKVHLITDDGRQFLKLTTNRYDLVTLEPPPPLNPGISRLYSREFYQAALAKLSDGGFVSQWLPEDILPAGAVDLIVSTFIDSMPDAFAFVGAGRTVILVGSNRPISLRHLRDRLGREPIVQKDLRRFWVEGVGDLVGSITDTPATLRSKWAGGPRIDDGRVSLDTIMISPVQFLDPRQEVFRFKEKLQVDTAAVRAWLDGQSRGLARDYDRFRAGLPKRPLAPLYLPSCYTDFTNQPSPEVRTRRE